MFRSAVYEFVSATLYVEKMLPEKQIIVIFMGEHFELKLKVVSHIDYG